MRTKYQSIKTDSQMKEMLKLANKAIEIVIETVIYTVKKLNGAMEDTRQNQIKLLEMKTTMSEMKVYQMGLTAS